MAKTEATHEDLRRHGDVPMGSEKSFGIVFTVVFALIGLWPLIKGVEPRYWAVGLGSLFLILAYAWPAALRPLNVLWFKFGMLLYKIVNPLVMGMLFYTTVTPIGLLMRATGKDPLNRSFDKNARSYWIERDPPGPEPQSMKNQF